MKKFPSTEELAHLGTMIHDHGFESNEQLLADITDLARQVRPEWPVLDVVADRAYPEVVRARAFSRLSADWDVIRAELETFRARFEADLTELLTNWNDHQNLRRSNAPVADLAESRGRLDAVRSGMGRYRQAVSR